MFLVLSVCLIATPADCHEERINVSFDNPNPYICMRTSQSTMAQWQGEHPEWTVKSWRCAAKGSLPKDL